MSRNSRRSVRKGQKALYKRDQLSSPEGDVVVDKRHLLDLALNTTSCAGCIASVRALLGQPLSELRMLKAIVEEDGVSALRLKELYLRDPKKMAQLLETFPMSTVLKKVQPVGYSQRCQLHRRTSAAIGTGSSLGWYRGSGSHSHGTDGGGSFVFGVGGNGGTGGLGGFGGGGGGWSGRGAGPAEPWDWEEAWDRLPQNLRADVATVKASTLEAAMQHVTESARFCVDCRHNVVQAHDILMDKMELEGCENEEEFDEELFRPFGDRLVFHTESGEKVLLIEVEDVEDLIYWHEGFSSQDFDSSSGGGQQRHAATLEQGQREVRSILGAVLLSQLRSAWHGHTAQVQAENYLFCLVVDSIRTQMAARGAATDDNAAADLIDMGSRCSGGLGGSKCSEGCSTLTHEAGEARRQKRRQKRKEKKRAGKSSASSAAPGAAPSGSPARSTISSPGTSDRSSSSASAEATRASRGEKGNACHDRSRSAEKTDSSRRKAQKGSTGDGSGSADGGLSLDRLHAEQAASRDGVAPGSSEGFGSKVPVYEGFGAGGLAFQLSGGGTDDASDDDVDHDLITEMEQLKARVRSRSDIDFLRKTLRQNYERFISRRAGAVLH